MNDARTNHYREKARREVEEYVKLPESAWQKRNYHLRQLALAADALHVNALDLLEEFSRSKTAIRYTPPPVVRGKEVVPVMASAEPNENGHPCPHCERKFTTQSGLNGHMKSHSKIYQP